MRNFLRIGDKVVMNSGETLTIKSLEFREFTCLEKIGYQKKNDIKEVK